MRRLTLVGLSLILIAPSCKPKTEHTIVQGYAKTYGSETTHAGIEIELYEEYAGATLIDKTVTNVDGWYQLEGNLEVGKSHYLCVINTPPLHDHLSNQPKENFAITSGGIQNFDLEIPPFCWLNIHFKNVDPCDQYDFVSFFGNHGSIERINGAFVDQFYLNRRNGNRIIKFPYTTVKCDSSSSLTKDFGFVEAFDTASFTVFY